MDLENLRLNNSQLEKRIYCSDGFLSNKDLSECSVDGIPLNRSQMESNGWSLRRISRRLLQFVDWAGERLAGAVGLTDSKFDIYLWQHEHLEREKAEREANTFIIAPISKNEGGEGIDTPLLFEQERSAHELNE